MDDAELLRRYAEETSEEAFAELVRRRIDLVYSVARRQVGGDAHLAEDVTQRVFTDLARKAKPLSRHAVFAFIQNEEQACGPEVSIGVLVLSH